MDKRDSTLELNIRRKIYTHIKKHPGLHERELSRQLKIPLSTLDYHLHYLSKRNLIAKNIEGKQSCYYIVGRVGTVEKKLLSILRQKMSRRIIIFLILNNFSNNKDICNHLGLASNTESFHLNKLVKLDFIDRSKMGREMIYSIKNPEYISDLLVVYQKSFLDDAVDRFVDTWSGLNPKQISKKDDK